MFRKANSSPLKKASGEAMNDNQKASAEKKQTRVMIIITVILSALTYHKVGQLEDKQTVVIVPYGAKSGDMLITGESASTGYVRMLARLIISDYGSVSKATIDQKSADILSLVYIDRYEDMRKKLNERAKYFKQFNSVFQSLELINDQSISITQNPADRNYKTDARNIYRLEFSAERRKFIGDKANPPETVRLKIDYTVTDSRFWILDIQG